MHEHGPSGIIAGKIQFENLFQFLVEIFKHALIITVFVLIMMLLIEYLTVMTRGKWSNSFERKPWLQVIFAALMGLTPGCLGVYVVVSMYAHRILNFAALVTVMIATSGDETFIMLGMIPRETPVVLAILLVVALISGWLLGKTAYGKRKFQLPEIHLKVHTHDPDCKCWIPSDILPQLKKPGPERAVLLFGGIIFLVFLLSGDIGPVSWNWQKVIFLFVVLIEVFIVGTVPDHFLKTHLWGHVIRKHFLRVFLWTFGAFLLIHIGLEFFHFEDWINDKQIYILILALLIGIIPESGPHILFISLYASGSIPLSILIANSIVQDGHGSLPLLAESRSDFIKVKLINLIIGGIVGFTGFLLGL